MSIAIAVTMALEFGKKVLMIDCDRQRSITKFGTLKDPIEEAPFCVDIETVIYEDSRSEKAIKAWLVNLEKVIEKALGVYDYIFIDVPGYMDKNLVSVFAYTDIVVIPVVMSEMDVLSTKDFIDDTMQNVFKLKKESSVDFKTFFAVNKITNRKNFRSIFEFADLVGIPVFENGLRLRDKHYDADLSLKTGITKGDKEHEVYKLTAEVIAVLDAA
jgi:cellulose biosynthesis protein BcsQ